MDKNLYDRICSVAANKEHAMCIYYDIASIVAGVRNVCLISISIEKKDHLPFLTEILQMTPSLIAIPDGSFTYDGVKSRWFYLCKTDAVPEIARCYEISSIITPNTERDGCLMCGDLLGYPCPLKSTEMWSKSSEFPKKFYEIKDANGYIVSTFRCSKTCNKDHSEYMNDYIKKLKVVIPGNYIVNRFMVTNDNDDEHIVFY